MSKIAEIRLLFEAKMKKGIPDPPGSFDPIDIERRVKSDKYLHRVLEHSENNVEVAADMLFDILVWRKTNNVNEISEQTVNMEYLKYGLFFPRGRDIDSCLIFIMKAKLFVKGQKDMNDLKRIIIYWLERIEREEDGKKITLFFDMDGCGLNNMDVDIITYMIMLLKNYYPAFINYIIVFQLPWILSAAFKIVKGILPAKAIERLRTVNKDKLKDLIAPEQALVSWGGKDEYTFELVPENKVDSEITFKTVTFADNNTNHSPGEMLSLNPPKVLMFKEENDKIFSQLLVKNMDESVVSFKIRTTAPEKYYVRPSSGVLNTGATVSVEIVVNSGFPINSVDIDRFLVVSMQIPKATMPSNELNEMWKNPSNQTDEYRLKCACIESEKRSMSNKSQDLNSMECKMNSLQNNHTILVKNIDVLKRYQIITMAFTFLSAVLGYLAFSNSKNNVS